MHLLASTTGVISDGEEAVDLLQTPGDIVILSAADSDLACLSAAQNRMTDGSLSLRLANILRLNHNLSVDLYVEKILRNARMVVVRLIGGTSYWPYGLSEVRAIAIEYGIKLVVVPGDDKSDPELMGHST
ncbi:MAG: cobaltochelatase subunit CobN, partial [Rhodospirillaceae bacterium]|nr:cobaltochelatase subunit CobN [Rhodospirillaceae bacterium]